MGYTADSWLHLTQLVWCDKGTL